jgi:hypothetical protein
LKNSLIFVVVCIGAWQFFLKDQFTTDSSQRIPVSDISNSSAMQTLVKAKEIAKQTSVYRCDGRQHCSQMTSYQEAKYFIQHCPNTKMDGDNDGIPCERQFNR